MKKRYVAAGAVVVVGLGLFLAIHPSSPFATPKPVKVCQEALTTSLIAPSSLKLVSYEVLPSGEVSTPGFMEIVDKLSTVPMRPDDLPQAVRIAANRYLRELFRKVDPNYPADVPRLSYVIRYIWSDNDSQEDARR